MKRLKRLLAAVLCMATIASGTISASAANYPAVETGKSDDGVAYTIKYPKIYGTINAEINMSDGVQKLQIPVVASGDAFVLTFTGGLTCARCPDCDKPYPDPNAEQSTPSPNANGTLYDGPCIHPIMVDGKYDINSEDTFEKDVFEWTGNMTGYLNETPNTLLLDYEKQSIGLRRLYSMMVDPDSDFSYALGNTHYDPQGDNTEASAYVTFKLGYYLRLPESTIKTLNFSKTYQTKDLELLIKGEMVSDTINQSEYETVSFETVNPTGSWDAIASYHQVNYKLENTTSGIDRVDIVIIPCVRGADFDFDGSHHMSPDSYYPLTVERIERTLQSGEVVRGSFRPQWGFESYLLKYVVIKLEPGDMELLQQNCIGELDRDMTYHPSQRTVAENQMASDFVYKYFAEYLK